MNIFFRVDSSIQIGTGHLMRCLTLADALREKESNVSFVCRELPGNLCGIVGKKGFKVYRLPGITIQHNNDNRASGYAQWLGVSWKEDAEQTKAILAIEKSVINWLIVDHYALDEQWETFVRPHIEKIMVIDDLADRPHNCDLLLDQNLYENMETRYEVLVPNHCQKLLGPKYALLRPEFKEARKNLRQRDGNVKRILTFFAGSDPTNETSKALEAVHLLNRPDIAVDVVIGAANPHKEQIKYLCSTIPNVTLYCQVENIAQLMVRADLAIGAGGTTTWERCCLGLPSIVITLADNQRELAKYLEKNGIIIYLDWYEQMKESDVREAINALISHPEKRETISKKSREIIDGKGIERVINRMQKNLYLSCIAIFS